MRILIAHSFYRLPGGEDAYVSSLAEKLRARHAVALLERRNIELGLGPGPRTAARMLYSRSLVAEIAAALRAEDPDVIHLHNAYPAFGPAVHLAARRERVPLVATVHNMRLRCPNGLMFTEGKPCHRCEGGAYFNAFLHRCFPTRGQGIAYATALWTHRFVLRLEQGVAIFVAPSRFMADHLRSWGIEAERVTVVRNAVEIPAPARPCGEGDYGLYVGRLSAEKGIDVLLEALAAAGNPPFVVAGGGPEAARLRARATNLSLSNLRWEGHVDRSRVGGLLAGARYVALPSVWDENAPLAAAEAMAHGRPLLASRVGGLSELVDGGRGIGCPPGDVGALATGVRRMMADPSFCSAAGAAARGWAESELSFDAHLDGLQRVYETAAASA